MTTNTLEAIQAAIIADRNGTKTIDEAIIEAIAQARVTCKQNGNSSSDCTVAWNIVEELQVEKAYQQRIKTRKTELELYCEQHPEAIECRMYDV
ncbi:MAG: hypothetical protein HRU34_16345 [Richelia sp.]|nr:hypothetical protein [Richelia sp.]CDN10837.1 hypothetical protein RintRC_1895 [Richelia intracellularis]